MMQIYYFTRTERSRTIAEALAAEQDVPIFQITDDQNWQGVRGFFKGGKMSNTKTPVQAHFDAPAENGRIILVFPLWAGSFPPAVRSFLQTVGKERIIAIPTSLGSRLKGVDRAGFVQVHDLVGKQISAPAWDELKTQ